MTQNAKMILKGLAIMDVSNLAEALYLIENKKVETYQSNDIRLGEYSFIIHINIFEEEVTFHFFRLMENKAYYCFSDCQENMLLSHPEIYDVHTWTPVEYVNINSLNIPIFIN